MTDLPSYRDVMKKLVDNGYKAFLVGGAVRNAYLNLPVKDYDIVTSATPEQVLGLFEGSREINAAFSVSVYVPSSEDSGFVEVTTMRAESDGDYSNGKPIKYTFTENIEEDLARRDATINAIATDYDGNVIDPFNGRDDLKHGRIVAIGEPADRIIAHPIRMMRYSRFGTALDRIFRLDENLVDAIIKNRRYLATESWDAIGKEFMKGLDSTMSWRYVLTLKHLGLLEIILPEIADTYGVTQNIHHNFASVWMHTIKAMKAADGLGLLPLEKFAVMLHDIGKPATRQYRDANYGATFYGHDSVGAGIARTLCRRMRLSEHDTQLVYLAVKHHMLQIKTTSQARKFFRKLDIGGNSTKEDLTERANFVMSVRVADSLSKDLANTDAAETQSRAFELVLKILEEEEPFRVTDLEVNGYDIMKVLNIKQGKVVGIILNGLLAGVVSGKIANEKGVLLDEAKRFYEFRNTVESTAVA